MNDKPGFSVVSVTILPAGEENKWTHWSEGLKMYITKNDITLILNSEEIEKLVKSLPRTVGGSYGTKRHRL